MTMYPQTIFKHEVLRPAAPVVRNKRIQSIDVLRGIVMIIMVLDHVRNFFHADAFQYSPTDLTRTNGFLFFTRFITHFCAPVFVFLAGISAYLYGKNKSRRELAYYLFTRGLWLVFAEVIIIGFGRTFNPHFPFLNLQVIWAIGISMIVLSALIFLNMRMILVTAILLIGTHNLLDTVHMPGSFFWSILHEPGDFIFGHFKIAVSYPLIPWIGIISLGYYFGSLYHSGYSPARRKRVLLSLGLVALVLFLFLRTFKLYGDTADWTDQKTIFFSVLSILNVTKYPPSLLYTLVTLGPALIFLGMSEKPLNSFTDKIAVFGRVPFFFYIVHIYMIHLLAMVFTYYTGHHLSDMILTGKVNNEPGLKGYGFDISVVYIVWLTLIFLLYPCCSWFDRYKRTHQNSQKWLSYL